MGSFTNKPQEDDWRARYFRAKIQVRQRVGMRQFIKRIGAEPGLEPYDHM